MIKIHRLPIPQFPEVFAEYTQQNGYREFLGLVSPKGDPLDRLFGALLMPDGKRTVLQHIAHAVKNADVIPPTTQAPVFSAPERYSVARRLLDPEDLGFQATAEIRDAARIELGYTPCESVPRRIRSQQA